ncbi:hypothetical protein TrRE_jg13533, partial [Triparma retinervis]
VVLRRTIGLKKDEFFLNRKRVNKNDVHSLLESAGFSKSNPYYIVQRGKVNALCMMKDEERLALLKEMKENESHRVKINEVITYIEERLSELENEKEERTAYQELDRECRTLEYTLYDKELRRAREALDELEHTRPNDAEATAELHESARSVTDTIPTVPSGDTLITILTTLGISLGQIFLTTRVVGRHGFAFDTLLAGTVGAFFAFSFQRRRTVGAGWR